MGSGLLKKANLLTQEKGLAFSDFLKKYNDSVFAIFSKIDNFYFITNSIGFDGLSILSSYSTKDFWNGLIPNKNKIYNFDDDENSLNKLLQFFSFEMKDKISSISVYSTDTKIFMLCNIPLTNEFIHDISFINDDNSFDISNINNSFVSEYEVNKYSIDYSEAVESYAMQKTENKPDLCEHLKNALFNEISNRLVLFFNSPNYSARVNETINNFIIFSKNKYEDNLLLNHIILNLKDVIEDCSQLITLSYCGKAETYSEIQEFFKVE